MIRTTRRSWVERAHPRSGRLRDVTAGRRRRTGAAWVGVTLAIGPWLSPAAEANGAGSVWVDVSIGGGLGVPFGSIGVVDAVESGSSGATLDALAFLTQGGRYVVDRTASCAGGAVAVLTLDRLALDERWEAHDTLVTARQLSVSADHDRVEAGTAVGRDSSGLAWVSGAANETAQSLDLSVEQRHPAVAGSWTIAASVHWTLTSCDGVELYEVDEAVSRRREAVGATEEQARERVDLDALRSIDVPEAVARVQLGRVKGPTMKVERVVYDEGDPSLVAAAKIVHGRHPDWQGAAGVWTELVEVPGDLRVQRRALHNLAVYHEQRGDVAEAIRMASRAVDLGAARPSRALLATLEGRAIALGSARASADPGRSQDGPTAASAGWSPAPSQEGR